MVSNPQVRVYRTVKNMLDDVINDVENRIFSEDVRRLICRKIDIASEGEKWYRWCNINRPRKNMKIGHEDVISIAAYDGLKILRRALDHFNYYNYPGNAFLMAGFNVVNIIEEQSDNEVILVIHDLHFKITHVLHYIRNDNNWLLREISSILGFHCDLRTPSSSDLNFCELGSSEVENANSYCNILRIFAEREVLPNLDAFDRSVQWWCRNEQERQKGSK